MLKAGRRLQGDNLRKTHKNGSCQSDEHGHTHQDKVALSCDLFEVEDGPNWGDDLKEFPIQRGVGIAKLTPGDIVMMGKLTACERFWLAMKKLV